MSVGLHLADFGTGYLVLAYRRSVSFHALKVDRSFVTGMDQATEPSATVRAIGSLAHLGMEMVAEGVGTRGQLEALRLRRRQGFLFSRPLPGSGRLLASGVSRYKRPQT